MDAAAITGILQQDLPGAAFEVAPSIDQPTLYVPREHLVATSLLLRDSPPLNFRLLVELTAVDWLSRDPRFEVVYHLACLGRTGPEVVTGRAVDPALRPARLRLKVRVSSADARLPTVVDVWPAAEWLEREVWDLFGIAFDGHPDMRRLMMPDDWEGHPLRKDYPVQVDVAATTSSPLQLTEEQFLANLARSRRPATPSGPAQGAPPREDGA